MRSTRNTTVVISTAVVAAFALGACGGSDGAASEAEICDSIQKIADVFDAGQGDSEEDAVEAVARLADAVDGFVDVAPSGIKSDAELLAKGTRVLAEADPEDPSDEAIAILEDDDGSLDEASEKVEEYALETCDIDLNA